MCRGANKKPSILVRVIAPTLSLCFRLRSPSSVGGWTADSVRLLNASNAQQAPLNGNTEPTQALAQQPKQPGWRVGQNFEANHLSHHLTWVAWQHSPHLCTAWESAAKTTTNKELQGTLHTLCPKVSCTTRALART